MRKERKDIALGAIQLNTGQIDWLPANPRTWTQSDIDDTRDSILEDPDFLEDRPLLVVPFGKAFVAFAGNLRHEGATAAKLSKVPCVVYHPETAADYETILRRAMKDNGQFGKTNWDAIYSSKWGTLPLEKWGLTPKGWTEPEGGEGNMPPEGGEGGKMPQAHEDDFNEDEDAIKVRCKPGDIWQLGEHRLMCGDSIDLEQVKKLTGGAKIDISFTSPPYGVNDGSLRKHQERGNPDNTARNFYNEYNDTQDGWAALITKTYQNMKAVSSQQFINIQLLADNKRDLVRFVSSNADALVDIMVWDKGHAAPQMAKNVLNNNSEFIFIFGKDNAPRTIEYGNFHGDMETILRVSRGKNEYADVHKAVFPVELPGSILQMNSRADSVLDLFGGTGTTMIAAEQLNRKCYMMELDPHYCDIILARWEKLTGRKAEKVNN